MVQAIINITKEANQVLNMVKAKYDLKDKSEAINRMAKEYGENILEPELRPEFVKKMNEFDKEPIIFRGSVKELRKRYEK